MKSLLCYGDSNTWGSATVSRPDNRYAPDERWPGVARAALGSDWLVIEEGLGGRTTVSDDPVEGIERNGRTYLLPCLMSHKPLDVIVIMLGTNDLKSRFNKTAWEIAAGAGKLVEIALNTPEVGRGGKKAAVLLVCPPSFLPLKEYADMFAGAVEKSREMARHYRKVAETLGVRFLDAGTVIKSSAVDGFHFDPDAHFAFGKAIAAEVGQMA